MRAPLTAVGREEPAGGRYRRAVGHQLVADPKLPLAPGRQWADRTQLSCTTEQTAGSVGAQALISF